MERKYRAHVALALTLVIAFGSFTIAPQVTTAQSSTTVGRVARTSAWMHNQPASDLRVTNPDGSLAYVNYTITDADSQSEFVEDATGTDLAAGEAGQSEIVPAEWFAEFFSADTDDTCLWDLTGDLALPGQVGAVNTDNEGTTLRFYFTPRKAKRKILLLRAVVENGHLVKKYSVRGLRSAFDSYANGIPFVKTAGAGMVKLAETVWVAIPMAKGDDMIFMDSGSVRVQVNRPQGATGRAAWLFGYSVKMAVGCDVQPPPYICEKAIEWDSPEDVLNQWCGTCDFPVFLAPGVWVRYANYKAMSSLLKGNGLLRLQGLQKLQAQHAAMQIRLKKADCNNLGWVCVMNGDLTKYYNVQETYGLTSVGDWADEVFDMLTDWHSGRVVNAQRLQELIEVGDGFMK